MMSPEMLPQKWQDRLESEGAIDDERKRARHVCDYIAGMTDRFAIREHEELFHVALDVK